MYNMLLLAAKEGGAEGYIGGSFSPETIAFFGVLASAIIGLFGILLTGKSDRDIKKIEVNGPTWQAFVDEITEFYKEKHEDYESRISDLESDVKEIKEELDLVTDKYKISISHIRNIHSRNPKISEDLPIPEEIQEDVDL